MEYRTSNIAALSCRLADVFEGRDGISGMIEAASQVLPFTAAFCIVNRVGAAPVYLYDTFPDGPAKKAVQLYVAGTYLLNPVYNAILGGLPPGLHRMADLAPDNWSPGSDAPEVLHEDTEEIGYRTPGWPTGLQELSLTVGLPDGATGEISFAQPSVKGGFSTTSINSLQPFYALFAAGFRSVWERQSIRLSKETSLSQRLEDFAHDILTPREAETVRMILKGHSSTSISLTLGIALPTVKSHRANAYSKLGISTQQQLFNEFLKWQFGSH